MKEINLCGDKLLSSLDNICEDYKVNHYDLIIGGSMSRGDIDTLHGVAYIFKYNHHWDHDTKVKFVDGLVRWMIIIDACDLFVRHPETRKVEIVERDIINFVSVMSIATYRVKVIPEEIVVRVEEQDLHHWIYNKIFNDKTEISKYKWCMLKINTNDMSYDISSDFDKIDMSDVKDAIMRHHLVFNDNYLLDVILYNDYLKNVVIGQMRRSMIEITNGICRKNLERLGDVDGDI